MTKKILIVEDQFIEANNLQMILERAGYIVFRIARSVEVALEIIDQQIPDLVLLDIYLKGDRTGIDLAVILNKKNIAFVYLSANSNKEVLDAAKATKPYGFLVKPFREKDVLVTLDIAHYLHQQNLQAATSEKNKALLVTAKEKTNKDIIGRSPSLLGILELLEIVAPMDTSVLILGESGTGKERIADTIHRLSPRHGKPFIKINCAALPATLIESELFGHERGAFTGASDRRIGKFEQAHGGTLFLDEIGEMPMDLQVKLLRVLQEKEIERIGGRGTIQVNVRIVAATNRDLEKEIAEGRFRIDLYYRLNVFPLVMPPLRERKEDIQPLALHFMERFASKAQKTITAIDKRTMAGMMAYDWPGNIRELENFIERSVLLTRTETMSDISLPAIHYTQPPTQATKAVKTMDDNERDNILAALKKCDGRIFGPNGAAELLGIPPSTLNSRMKRLGIEKKKEFL